MRINFSSLPPATRGAVAENTQGLRVVVQAGRIAGWVDEAGRTVTADDRVILPDVAEAVGRLVSGLPDGLFGLTGELGADVLPSANPYAAGTFNLTRQIELQKVAPTVAQHLRASASPEPNPFAKGPTFNLTRQIDVQKADPATADRLRREAGA